MVFGLLTWPNTIRTYCFGVVNTLEGDYPDGFWIGWCRGRSHSSRPLTRMCYFEVVNTTKGDYIPGFGVVHTANGDFLDPVWNALFWGC